MLVNFDDTLSNIDCNCQTTIRTINIFNKEFCLLHFSLQDISCIKMENALIQKFKVFVWDIT